jgi:hypothetical protein
MANVTIGNDTEILLQPDWKVSKGREGEAVVTLNYKGKKSICEDWFPAPGDLWDEVAVEIMPSEGLEVVSAEIRGVGNGNDAILTVNLLFDIKEEMAWDAENLPIELHPKVTAAAISNADYEKISAALKNTSAATSILSGASAAAQALYELKLKGTRNFTIFLPVITTTNVEFCDDVSRMGGQGKTITRGNFVESPVLVYINYPTTDNYGNTYTWVRQPDSFTVENGVVIIRRQWKGYIGVVSWMYNPSASFP